MPKKKNRKISKLKVSTPEAMKEKINEIVDRYNNLDLEALGPRLVQTLNRMVALMDLMPVNPKDD